MRDGTPRLLAAVAGLFVAALGFIAPAFAEPGDAADAGPTGASPLANLASGLAFGGWTDSLPLELPPAPRGLTPELAFNIDFRVNEGWMGPSMQLAGFSRIDLRSPTGGVPNLDGADDAWVDGQALYAVTALFYKPEQDDDRWFYFAAGNNTWIAQRDGWTWTWGPSVAGDCAVERRDEEADGDCVNPLTPDEDAVDLTTSWLLTRVEDPFGNTIEYAYTTGGSVLGAAGAPVLFDVAGEYAYDHIPASITYANGYHRVDLSWEERFDVPTSARSGTVRANPVRLAGLEVVSNVGGAESGRVSDAASATYAVVYADATGEAPCRDSNTTDSSEHETTDELDELINSGLSLVHRLIRVENGDAFTGGNGRTLRCIERNAEDTSFETVADPAFTDAHALATPLPSGSGYNGTTPVVPPTETHTVVGFDGDAVPDLLYLSTACRNGGADHENADSCNAPSWQYFENQGGSLQDADAHGPRPEPLAWLQLYLDAAFFNGGGAWAAVDIDRDGRSELLAATLDAGTAWDLGVMYHSDMYGTWSEVPWFAVDASLPEVAAELLRHGQWADIDADGFVDLVIPIVDHVSLDGSGTVATTTQWLRNRGSAPFFDLDDLAALPTPLEEADPGLLPEAWADILDECTPSNGSSPGGLLDPYLTWPASVYWSGPGDSTPTGEPPVDTSPGSAGDQTRYTGLDFESFEHYVGSQARWGDYNNDGAADVAYALYGCWKNPSSLADDDAFGPVGDTYSTIFYGDGRGAFSDSHTSAGAAFLAWVEDYPEGWSEAYAETWTWLNPAWRSSSSFAALDLGHTGRTGIYSSTEHAGVGLEEGFRGAGTALPLPALAITQPSLAYDQLLADWNGDGFTDALVYDRDGMSAQDGLYLNERAVARYRPTVIHGPWGGETALTYDVTSAHPAEHPQLANAMDVIASVTNEAGTTSFQFFGGVFWGAEARFMGFRDVAAHAESGANTAARFVQAPWGVGSLAYRVESRADGTIARVTHNRYVAEAPYLQTWDTEAPFYNPLGHRCDVEVGPGTGTWPARSQTTGVETLVVACEAEGNAGTVATDGRYFDAMGWTYGEYVNAVSQGVQENVWTLSGENPFSPGALGYSCASGTCSWTPGVASWSGGPGVPVGPGAGSGPGTPPVVVGAAGAPPPVGGSGGTAPPPPEEPAFAELEWPGVTDEVEFPVTPDWAFDTGSATTETRMYTRWWLYNYAHRLVAAKNNADVTETDDDSSTYYTYDGGGERLSASVFGPSLSWERSEAYSSFVGFDTPQTVVQVATNGNGGTQTRTLAYAYDAQGSVTTFTDAELHTSTATNDACGLAKTQSDAVGRTETTTFNAACQPVSWSYQGATRDWTYDAYGRVETLTTLASATAAVMTETWTRDDDLDRVDDRTAGYRDEPRAGVVDAAGGLRLLYLDPWGREYASVACENAGPVASSVSTVLAAVSCNTAATASTQPVYTLRAWALDGSPRFVSAPFYSGETVVGSWSFIDELGRPRFTYAPAPDVVADYVETEYAYDIGRASVTDPVGTACLTESTTLESNSSCEGVFRGSRVGDAFGRTLTKTDAAGRDWSFAYDGWGRMIERVAPSVDTSSGAIDPTWTWTYTDDDLESVATAPDGTSSTTTYDDAHRPDARAVDGPTMAPLVTDDWAYLSASASTPAMVSHEDANGRSTTSQIDGLGRVGGTLYPDLTIAVQTYNAAGAVATATNVDGLTTTYDYDALGRLVSETDAATQTRSYTYLAAGQIETATDRDGVLTEYAYTYDNRLSASYVGGYTLVDRTYRDDGQVTLATEGGVTTAFTYDTLARKETACVGYAAASTPACAVEFAWTYTDLDQVETETQGTSTWSYAYNALGWLERKDHPNSTYEAWRYTPAGKVADYADLSALASSWTYDDLGRPTEEALPGKGLVTFSYTLDATADHDERVTRSEPDGGTWDRYVDFRGRSVRSVDPLGDEVRATYAGTQLRQVDYVEGATGATIARDAYTYDALGRVETRCGPTDDPTCEDGGGFSPSTVYGFEYGYSAEGRMTSREGFNDRTNWHWNPDGTLADEEIEGVTTLSYDYAADYPRVELIEAGDGVDVRTTSRSYHRGLWLQNEEITETGNPDAVYRHFDGWDAFGTPRLAERYVGGALESRYSSVTDDMGRLRSLVAETSTGFAGTMTWGHAGNGSISSIYASWAGDVSYSRDPTTGLVTSLFVSTGTAATVTSRDVMGRPESIALAGGGSINTVWDTLGRVEERTTQSGGANLQTRVWGYDSRGRSESQATYTNGTLTESMAYGFDEPGWLTSEEKTTYTAGVGSTTSTEYDYDLAGNRTAKRSLDLAGAVLSTETYAYAWGNELTSVSGASVTWNAYGEVTTDHRGQDLQRDADGAEWGIGTATGTTNVMTRDPWGVPIVTDADGDDATNNARVQLWGPSMADAPIAGVDESGDGVLYLALEGITLGRMEGGVLVPMGSDKNGSVMMDGLAMLGDAGAFGQNAVSAAGSDETRVYGGLDLLAGTGYQLPRQRLYDASIGRFASMDPSGLDGGEHRFVYTGNDPVDFVDPGGLEASSVSDPRTTKLRNPNGLAVGDLEVRPGQGQCGAGDDACQSGMARARDKVASGILHGQFAALEAQKAYEKAKAAVDAANAELGEATSAALAALEAIRGVASIAERKALLALLLDELEAKGWGETFGVSSVRSATSEVAETGRSGPVRYFDFGPQYVSASFQDPAKMLEMNVGNMADVPLPNRPGAFHWRDPTDLNGRLGAVVRKGVVTVQKACASRPGACGAASVAVLATVEVGLSIGGLLPVVGEPLDWGSGFVSAGRGDPSGLVLSAAAGAAPLGGQVPGVAKIIHSATTAVGALGDAVKFLGAGEGLASTVVKKLGGQTDELAGKVGAEASDGLPGNALVCRGGTCTADRFATGSGVTIDDAGKLQGVSVNSAPGKSVQELSTTFKQNQVGVSTVGDVRASGGDVVRSPTAGNPNHCTMCGITPEQAEDLFTPTSRNLNK